MRHSFALDLSRARIEGCAFDVLATIVDGQKPNAPSLGLRSQSPQLGNGIRTAHDPNQTCELMQQFHWLAHTSMP
jgi:hypothetical protein